MASPQSQQTGFLTELCLGIFVLGLFVILIIELPPVLIDLFITINITIGIVLISISLYVQRPLDLAAFPSVILIGTVFRLVLSIAATRSILTKAEAGQVIHTFGEFVTGGNIVVGFVIFLIITIVQFLVITKGSERIAEVAARFALDAMPGKQMTIDADFNQGLISPEEAVMKREELSRESALYGSLDGAMKFVKGDTIAGIIITVINIIGGLVVGILMMQMEPMDAVETFTKLTIGDGLSAQIPSLLMAISCGITMTRTTASDKSLARDIFAQLMNKPNSMFFAAGFLFFIAITSFITGLPAHWFMLLALLIGFAGFTVVIHQDVQMQYHELESVKRNMQDLVNPNKMYERLGVDILSLQVGNNLLVIADPEKEGQLLAKIAALRQRMTDEYGYIIPSIRIMDSTALTDYEYLISIRGNNVANGFVYPGKFMVMAEQWDSTGRPVPSDAITGTDPTYQQPVYWLTPEAIGEDSGITAVHPENAIISHLQECLRKYVDEIMTKTDVIKLMELVKTQDPTLINDLVPAIISTSDLRKIFVNLIREKVSIKDIIFIFERLCDYARFSREPDILSERLRAALGRQICLSNATPKQILYVITLSQEWEKTLDDSCQRTELGTMFLLNPLQVQELIELSATTLMKSHQAVGYQPIILCSPRIRLPLYQLLERHIPTVVVMSYSELITDIRVEQVDTIGEESYDGY
ncbi:MAG: FHIPEP family type III secretion protein [Candidatus Gastranaerophilales bacterium]|nr:FHIPEP family type III secretion protein [Candidatus Gastranaerophilales bacterium]